MAGGLKINGNDLWSIYDIEHHVSDWKYIKMEWAFSNFPYVKPFFESSKFQIPQIKKNGVPVDFCYVGGRPSFKNSLRTLSNGGDSWSIWKSSDKKWYQRDSSGNDSEMSSSVFRSSDRILLYELLAAGGGGTGGNALLAGVGGGAGGYAVVAVDFEVLVGKIVTVTTGAGGQQASARGNAGAGGDTVLSIDGTPVITCHGGGGADGGNAGAGGTVEIGNLPSGVQVLYAVNGLSGLEGTGTNTSSCPAFDVWAGFETEGDDYKLSRGGYSVTTDGNAAGAGASSQLSAGGKDGGNGSYNGQNGGNGAGGGGGRPRAFSSSNGGNGGNGYAVVYNK